MKNTIDISERLNIESGRCWSCKRMKSSVTWWCLWKKSFKYWGLVNLPSGTVYDCPGWKLAKLELTFTEKTKKRVFGKYFSIETKIFKGIPLK